MGNIVNGKLSDKTVTDWTALMGRHGNSAVEVRLTSAFRLEYEQKGQSHVVIVPVGAKLVLFRNVTGQYARSMRRGGKRGVETQGTFFMADKVISIKTDYSVSITSVSTPSDGPNRTRTNTQNPGFR